MPRKGPATKRVIIPDPVYNDRQVARFINRMLVKGKRSVAERIFYGAMDLVGERSGAPPLEVFQRAMKNVMPVVEVKPRRVGGAPTTSEVWTGGRGEWTSPAPIRG